MEFDKDLIEQVRSELLEDVEAHGELYDELDVTPIRNDDWQVERYLIRCKGDLERSVTLMKQALQFRKSIGLARMGTSRFPIDFFRIGAVFQSLPDKQNRGVLFMRLKYHHRVREMANVTYLFSLYNLNKLDVQTEGKGMMVVVDVKDSGLASMDLELAYRLAETIIRYYSYGKIRILVLDLPQEYVVFWNIVKRWIPEEYRDMATFIKREEIFDYIDTDNVPFYLGGNSPLNYYSVPSDAMTDEQVVALGFVNQQQIEQIRESYRPLFQEAEEQSQLIKDKFGDRVIESYDYGITNVGTKN